MIGRKFFVAIVGSALILGATTAADAAWKWPTFPGFGSSAKKPSVATRIKTSSKSMWDKTTDVINPWKKDPVPVKQPPTGYRTAKRPQKPEPKSTGFWPFSKPEEKPAAKTIRDFLELERPGY